MNPVFDEKDGFGFETVGGNTEEITQTEIQGTERDITADVDTMNLIFLLDTSGSMYGQRIDQLNNAMPPALEAAREVAMDKEVQLFVRIVEFNSSATWIMGDAEHGVEISDAYNNWKNLDVTGSTDTAGAIRLAMTCMHTKYLGTKNYHPVVILITDGNSNDPDATKAAIEELKMALSGGNPNKKDKVWRFAIGVVDYNEAELNDFAMLGTLENEYGDEKSGVPMVFKVDKIENFAKVLKTVTVSSLVSNTPVGNAGGGAGGPSIPGNGPVIPVEDDIIDF